jgi:hypothetical protein
LVLLFWQRLPKQSRSHQLKLSAVEEDEILVEARRLFLKKVEQAVRKADAAKESD